VQNSAANRQLRAESDEPCRLLSLLSAQDLLYCSAQIVVPDPLKDPTKPGKGQLVSFQESLPASRS